MLMIARASKLMVLQALARTKVPQVAKSYPSEESPSSPLSQGRQVTDPVSHAGLTASDPKEQCS